jgi:hypothetical protein
VKSTCNSIIVIVLLLAFTLGLFPACITVGTSGPESSIQLDAGLALVDATVVALTQVDLEADSIAKELRTNQINLLKLEQVGIPSEKWIADMTAQANKENWNPLRLNVTKDLKLLKNDTWEVVKLQFSVDAAVPQKKYSSVITIYETATAKEYKYIDLHSDFLTKVESLKQLLKSRNDGIILAVNTIRDVLPWYPTWKAAKLDGATYQVRGQGLGLAVGQTVGEWRYTPGTKNIVPADDPAMALSKVLSAK